MGNGGRWFTKKMVLYYYIEYYYSGTELTIL